MFRSDKAAKKRERKILMSQYSVTYSCGHSGSVSLFGPHKERERKLEWLASAGLCPECLAKEREAEKQAELKRIADNADEYGLPQIIGSEKQVAWALKIRDKFMKQPAVRIQNEKAQKGLLVFLNSAIDGVLAHEKAHWWIENRESKLLDLLKWGTAYMSAFAGYFGVEHDNIDGDIFWDGIMEQGLSVMTPDEIYNLYETLARGETPKKGVTPILVEEKEVAAEEEAERTIRPEQPKSENPAKIEVRHIKKADIDNKYLFVYTPVWDKNIADFLRKVGLEWASSRWSKKILPNVQDTDDRIIEIAVHLLSEGYVVTVPDRKLAERAIKADYQPLQTRWVRATTSGEFSIRWARDDGDFYQSAKRISGAHWDSESRSVKVPASSFLEVEDFAEQFGFRLSDKAIELAEKARIIKENALVSDVRPVDENKPKPLDRKPRKLEVPMGEKINDSLLDND
jgi:hypothetical protein